MIPNVVKFQTKGFEIKSTVTSYENFQEKASNVGLKLPFLNDEKLSDKEKSDLESKFWLMVLRAGGMDPQRAYQVLMNYIGIINNHPEYFAASKPPTKLDPVFQQKVFL